ncbi:DUF7289 family protein [Methanohalophilus portucalensis]|uniref:Uncharacterized protein n=2 Tax=Methanohalophilus portucalensis TaxID=39664 RepID=A0A1L9C2Y0_9EURY|nr:hypothetical protein [Methanohalophilus portucalensis]ATU07683.1 hypothetical protein BKM01_02150 [Methanohalophilus portucalensis]OJH48831.1 hypothetical protein MPF_1679 [Methanohalophilus portucalensis FDF-1]RNI08805.1 hypothetical protein EFE41_09895 [Methanohalophilus portucalensis FDF-1]SMH36777.1 hypothetical protein SAMN06264941_1084 [Methanohalophilus portucalensis FDF-1]
MNSVKQFFKSESAVSTVVSFVLLLGLFVTVLAVFNAHYIPEWKADAEKAHMDDVYDDMSQLKARADMLSLASSLDEKSTVSLSIPIKMGGGDIPIVGPTKSSGMLSVNDGIYKVDITGTNSTGSFIKSYDLGTIGYSSNNGYYVDQTFAYENGAVIVSQRERSLMKLDPSISIKNQSGTLLVDLTLMEIAGDRVLITSNGIEEVKLTSNDWAKEFENKSLTNLTISMNTSYPSAWAKYLNDSAKSEDLVYSVDYNIDEGDDYVTFDLNPPGVNIALYLNKATVDARVGTF